MRRRSRDERHGRRPHGAPLLPDEGAQIHSPPCEQETRTCKVETRETALGKHCSLPRTASTCRRPANKRRKLAKSRQEKLRLASAAACRDLPAHVCFEERQPDRAPHMCAVALHRGAISASGSAASCSQPACLGRVWPAVTLTHVPRVDKHVNAHVVLGSATMLGACPRGRGLYSSTCQLLAAGIKIL